MSLLVIWASPNVDGLTATAKDRILAGIEKAGVKTETVHLNSCAIKRCLTCDSG